VKEVFEQMGITPNGEFVRDAGSLYSSGWSSFVEVVSSNEQMSPPP
jgi:hypothetical protein